MLTARLHNASFAELMTQSGFVRVFDGDDMKKQSRWQKLKMEKILFKDPADIGDCPLHSFVGALVFQGWCGAVS